MQLEIKTLLDELYDRFNTPDFIVDDPISIPHNFTNRQDIEIAGFLTATLAWGNRKSILRSASQLVSMMDGEPFRFVMEASEKELLHLSHFVHRTFNGTDCLCFITSLRNLYLRHHGIGVIFEQEYARSGDLRIALSRFRNLFFELEHPQRSEKHLSSIDHGAACKRMNMYLKWMVRSDNRGVDFGLWTTIPASALYLPLDLHTANIGRLLGLLTRKQNDWRAVEQITASLRLADPNDPVKYDFALFGAGISKILDDDGKRLF